MLAPRRSSRSGARSTHNRGYGCPVKVGRKCGAASDRVAHSCGPELCGITLTSRCTTMQITSKGQVTIPQEIRNRLGLLPHTKVEFELAGDHARIRKARRPPGESVRGRLALEVLRGTADTRMSTDEILALTRGGTRATTRRK